MSNAEATIYEIATGRLIGHVSLSEGASFALDGAATVPGKHDLAGCYYDPATGLIQPRLHYPAVVDRTRIAADGTDAATIGPCPDGSDIRIDGGDWQPVTGRTIHFAVEHAGTYAVELRCWPHLDASFTIEAAQP